MILSQKRSFSLLEMVIVIGIIGFIAGIVAMDITSIKDGEDVRLTKISMQHVVDALKIHKVQQGKYPSTDQGIPHLTEEAGGRLLMKIPTDAWHNEFIYQQPGSKNLAFDLYSLGADGMEGGEGYNADIYYTEF